MARNDPKPPPAVSASASSTLYPPTAESIAHELGDKAPPAVAVADGTIVLTYASAEHIADRCSADDAVIRMLASVASVSQCDVPTTVFGVPVGQRVTYLLAS